MVHLIVTIAPPMVDHVVSHLAGPIPIDWRMIKSTISFDPWCATNSARRRLPPFQRHWQRRIRRVRCRRNRDLIQMWRHWFEPTKRWLIYKTTSFLNSFLTYIYKNRGDHGKFAIINDFNGTVLIDNKNLPLIFQKFKFSLAPRPPCPSATTHCWSGASGVKRRCPWWRTYDVFIQLTNTSTERVTR